jgi:hypothetical protein
MKKFLTVIAMSVGSVSVALALQASDNAANAVYSGGTFVGLNGGTGFSAWTGSTTGGGGRYMGASGLSASTTFALFSTASGFSEATRPFSTAMAVGDTFSFAFGYTGVADPGGEIGINLFSGANFRLNLKFVGGSTAWVLNDGGNNFSTGISWGGGNPGTTLLYSFTRGTGNGYSISLSQGLQTYIGNNFTGSLGTMDIDRVQFYTQNQGNNENIGINNLSVVPEPSTYALLALAAAGFGAHVVRRRRRA